jgi:hypothetical protein
MHIRQIDKLSRTRIDADKDWEAKGITSLKQLADSMQKGDLLVMGTDGYLIILSPGSIGSQLMAHDPGNLPTFAYPP